MTAAVTLAARLDLASVAGLAAELDRHAGGDLVIDAGRVDHLGALPAQLLLAARQQWAADGQKLVIDPRSPAFDQALAVMGLTAHFAQEGAA